MRELSLFTGAGGGVYGTMLLGARVVCYVERDLYCQQIIQQRIADGIFEGAPIFDDVRSFNGLVWRGRVDLITAGFPCQPFSIAGRAMGADDPRNCWPDTARIIREVRPRFCLLENSPALAFSGYLGTVLGDLAACGYDAAWSCLSARDCGAPHERDRIWILAALPDADSERGAPMRGQCETAASSRARREPELTGGARDAERQKSHGGPGQDPEVPHTDRERSQTPCVQPCGHEAQISVPRGNHSTRGAWWRSDPAGGACAASESRVDRVADGVAYRRDRVRAIGNGQVPAVVARVFVELLARLREEV